MTQTPDIRVYADSKLAQRVIGVVLLIISGSFLLVSLRMGGAAFWLVPVFGIVTITSVLALFYDAHLEIDRASKTITRYHSAAGLRYQKARSLSGFDRVALMHRFTQNNFPVYYLVLVGPDRKIPVMRIGDQEQAKEQVAKLADFLGLPGDDESQYMGYPKGDWIALAVLAVLGLAALIAALVIF